MDSYLTFDSQISQFNIFMKKNQMPHVIFVNSTCLPQIYRYKIKTLKNKDLCVIIDVNCGRQEQNDHCQAPTYTNYPIFADKKSLGTQASSFQLTVFTLYSDYGVENIDGDNGDGDKPPSPVFLDCHVGTICLPS